MTEGKHEITELLGQAAAGDELATSQLLPLVYDQLRAMAQRCMNSERIGHTLRRYGAGS